MSDHAIRNRLASLFEAVDGLSEVRVAVTDGVVSLTGTVLEPSARDLAGRLAGRVEHVATVRNEIALDDSLTRRLSPGLARVELRLRQAVEMLPLLAIALGCLLVVALLGIWVSRWTWPWGRVAPNAFVEGLYRQAVRLVFFVAGLVLALDIAGATALLGTILGAAGIVGLAVGFAVRDTIENYLASVMLSIRQPFRPNDHVRIEGHEGHVLRLTSRATILLSFDGNHVRIPNAAVFKAVIVNFTRNPERRLSFRLGVNADADLRAAVADGLAALRALPFMLDDPPAEAWIDEVGESNVVLFFCGWVDQRHSHFGVARGEAIRMVKEALEQGGFELPEPIYRLRLEGAEAAQALAAAPTRPAAGRSAPPAPEPEAATDVARPEPVARKVEEERRAGDGPDLLDRAAPEE
ncbi:mechanosensitive ion channel domain-containing protein [Marinibaculum pumilum]|uniref:Small-conductance mechanosensitive channel n=1 Tax=Marinibaculum pumilum TaxID=1766165 RepID=A0ABV7L2W0_9PROT